MPEIDTDDLELAWRDGYNVLRREALADMQLDEEQKDSYLTREEVSRAVKAIEEVSWDYEKAHGMEDDLYLVVLRTIAFGALSEGHGAALAEEALKTRKLDFARR